jgi:hypothetical protein
MLFTVNSDQFKTAIYLLSIFDEMLAKRDGLAGHEAM